MTVIRPNSITGITSITAQANEINVFRHNGVLAGLQLNGVNHHTSAGVSTFHTVNVLGNLDVAGVLTYQDVTNVDSLGIGTFRVGVNVPAGQLDVGSNIKLGNAGVVTATSFVGNGANASFLNLTKSSTTAYNAAATTNDSTANLINSGAAGHATLQFQSVSGGSANTGQATISVFNESSGSKNTALTFGTRQNSDATVRERLRITSSGHVGIGTDAPAGGSYLHIQGGGTSDKPHIRLTADRGLIARLGDTSGGAQAMFDLYDTDGSTQIVRFISGGGHNFVNTGGNFGVGTNSPNYKTVIQVSDTTAYSASTISANQFQLAISNSGANGVAGILLATEPSSGNGGHCGIRALSTGNGSSDLTFSTRGSSTSGERVRITSGGDLMVGTTGSSGAKIQIGNHTFAGTNFAYNNDRVGFQNNGNLTCISNCSTYNDATHPGYGIVLVQGPTTSSYNTWGICPDGPAKGNSLNFHYGPQETNIHGPSLRKFEFTGEGYALTPNMPYCMLGRGSSFSVASVTGTAIIFDTKAVDRGGNYNTSNGRFTAPVAGDYLLMLIVEYNPAAGVNQFHTGIWKNGAHSFGSGFDAWNNHGNEIKGSSMVLTANLAVNDYIQFATYHGSGGTQQLTGGRCKATIRFLG